MPTRPSPHRLVPLLAAALSSLLAGAPSRAQTTIVTNPAPVGGGVGFVVNAPTGLPYRWVGEGQTFVSPAAVGLLDFSFWFDAGEKAPPVAYAGELPFVARIYAWGSGAPIGPPLFTSPVTTSPAFVGPTGWVEYTFPVGGLALAPNAAYLALITVLGVPNDGAPRGLLLNGGSADVYPPGLRVDVAEVLATGELLWFPLAGDYTFVAHLTPEPGSLALAASGLLALALAARRRRTPPRSGA